MNSSERIQCSNSKVATALPKHRELYYDGAWREPSGGYVATINPATGENLGSVADADASDVDRAVRGAHKAFLEWRRWKPRDRGAVLKKVAAVLREHAEELALLDAANCGNPVTAMIRDGYDGPDYIDFFAGLATETKGDVTPMGEEVVNLTVQEPYGVCARVVAYNHPYMFAAMKIGAPLVTGNCVIIKPPPQAPLSALRMFELIHGLLPPGVLSLLSGGRVCGEALSTHPLTPVVTLVGSVQSGRAVARACAERLKHVVLELGGKNAMIVYPDADIGRSIEGALKGMNFTWCGQSCGSTSRLFLHESVYDRVLEGVLQGIKRYKPGIPTEPETTMGAIISKTQLEKVMSYIELGKQEGATLAAGGGRPHDPHLQQGFFVQPTVFTGVHIGMRIAREEIFGPVLSVLRWSDEEAMLEQVNSVEFGLTASIYTSSLRNAHHAARQVESGYVWVNNAGPHFVGVPFGGYKQSGIGREESIKELYTFTQTKNIHMTL
jgi:betaine-aldehyde dehydrogenase